MARMITPDEAMRPSENDVQERDRVIEWLSKALKAHDWTNQETYTVAAKSLGKGWIRESVLGALNEAGWTVKFQSDQREGDFYDIRA